MVGISKRGIINKNEFMFQLEATNVVAWIKDQSNKTNKKMNDRSSHYLRQLAI